MADDVVVANSILGDLVEMLNEHFTAMTHIIFDFEGTLDKFMGDEIMAVFGSPMSAGEDSLRAAKAALAIMAQNGELNQKRADEDKPTFEIGIGITTGEVVAGYIGAPERMEFTVVGDRVNTARRLCSLAGPGQIVTDEATYEHIKDAVVTRAKGTVILKGKEEPLHAYEILELKPEE